MKRLALLLLWLAAPVLRANYPWTGTAPADIAAAALTPDTVLDEQPCNWRPALTPIASRLVHDCNSAREAVLQLAARLSRETGVHYSTSRRKHNMNALEALAEKKVSCTGQSILLVCALRSVGIPARAAGVPTWNHIRGNHTWVEAWFDGTWHMIEFNEKEFNTPWVMENIGMLDTRQPEQRIKAASPAGKERWTLPSDQHQDGIAAEDVTERYLALSLSWYQHNGLHPACQRLMVDIQPRCDTPGTIELLNENNRIIDTAGLPRSQDDMRYRARLALPRQGQFYLRVRGSSQKIPVHATESAVQLIQLQR